MSTLDAGEWPLRRLLSEVVGSGPRSAEDMTREQAREAFERILAGEPTPTALGAFWLANRWKRNTPEELAAFVDAMRESSVRTAAPTADPVDCGANYDGKTDTALLGVAAGAVAAAAGTPVVVHSGDRVPVDEATAYRHVLDELGIRTDLDPEESAAMVDETGFGFYDGTAFNPLVDDLLERRREVGVRTFVNTVETLANPADADVHLGSFFHLSFARKLARTFHESETAGVERALFVQGLGGYDDVRPRAKFAEWHGGTVEEDGETVADVTTGEIDAAELGLDFEVADLDVADVARDSAALTEAVLDGRRDGPVANAVAVNAAVRIYARGDVDDLADGVERARRVLDDGDATAVLEELRAF